MLRLIRHIRQSFLEKGNIQRYLLYAVGEILLVMVGILLALQVNNWNEKKKIEDATISYHYRLLEDLRLIQDDVKDSYDYAEDNFDAITTSLRALEEGTLNAEEDSVFNRFLNTYFKFQLNLEDLGTYMEMQSAGDLNLISNLELRDGFSGLVDRKYFIEEVHRTFHRNSHLESDYLDPYLFYTFTVGSQEPLIRYDFRAMKADSLLIRKVSRQAMLWAESLTFHESFLGQINSLLTLLESEIKKLP